MKKLKSLLKKMIPHHNFLQRIYLGFYYIGLWGMNYGRTSDLQESGELKALRQIQKLLPKTPLVLMDVGANIGDYSITLSSEFPNAEIHAFEPVSATYSLLAKNVDQYKNIHTHNIALGESSQSQDIYFGTNNTHSSMIGLRGDSGSLQKKETIQVEALDSYFMAMTLDKIDFLKIDVEGFEINVLRGAKKLLDEKKIGCIQFEFGGTMIDARIFLKDFYDILGSNYTLYRVTKCGLYPMGVYQPHFEIFHYCNYVALLK